MTILFRGHKGFSQPSFWADVGAARWPLIPGDRPGREAVPNDFAGYVALALKKSGPVAAVTIARQMLISEGRFQYRRRVNGRLQEPFGDASLALLEQPWPGASTGDLLSRMELDASFAGNSYHTLADDSGRLGARASGPNLRIARLRPDWVTIVHGSPSAADGDPNAADSRVLAYSYEPRGTGVAPRDPVLLLPAEVAHFSPIPDPDAMHRGMSWLTPVLEEIEADRAATRHKSRFFARGASPRLSVTLPREANQEDVDRFKALMEAQREGGPDDAYKTMFFTSGVDIKTLGVDLKQLDFKATQGAGETRIAAAGRVPPVIAGLSEGLQGSSLNAGNFGAARRLFVEGWAAPTWRMMAAALQKLVRRPGPDVELWVDTRDIPFLREDARDQADIQAVQATAIRTLVDAGWAPDAAVSFVLADNLGALAGQHSGLYSVQLQAPGAQTGGQP